MNVLLLIAVDVEVVLGLGWGFDNCTWGLGLFLLQCIPRINLALTVTLLPTTTYGVISAIILSLFFSSKLPLANISCCELQVQEEEESQGQAD